MTITEMLSDLTAQGWSQARIAEHCNTTQPTIFRITKGGDTRYEVGKAIESLHRKITKAARKEPRPTFHSTGEIIRSGGKGR
ncbi:hypothetical protein DA456_05035 [Pseudomonas syringae pv. atrofaciens]|uniref:Uncharacterized protein n=1 Tax=Pseudomonas syringae pv. atrofaciens TaxID=192087 RepID=A0AAD0I7K8_PSESX|nr:hypothetical protein DA456_05035 [Pseudomonas syringae pv. atrofaciens]